MIEEQRGAVWWLKAFLVAFLSLDINLVGKHYFSYSATSPIQTHCRKSVLYELELLVYMCWRQQRTYIIMF